MSLTVRYTCDYPAGCVRSLETRIESPHVADDRAREAGWRPRMRLNDDGSAYRTDLCTEHKHSQPEGP